MERFTDTQFRAEPLPVCVFDQTTVFSSKLRLVPSSNS